MATAIGVATIAIFVVVALSASQVKSNVPDCCEDGMKNPQYRCSPLQLAPRPLNSFEKGKDGGGPSECDNAYNSDEEKVVARRSATHPVTTTLSTPRRRCGMPWSEE
ncbi:hypothetical protein HU200_049582 [Digitaria exilis]|uniref:Uncharacterized protein n=1 Tax=Digitaria exilis TaxID=1010633 RepID=A0A835EBY3_9POAL|nr:hypothetical protein HU200_049582 [Digitaria exilis]